MSTQIVRNNMTDAELIDEGLFCDSDSLAFLLATRLDGMPIFKGNVQSVEDDCNACSKLKDEISDLEREVSSLQSDLEYLDINTLINGAKRAKEAVKSAHDKLNYLFKLGGDDDQQ